MKSESVSCLFSSPDTSEAYLHTNWEVSLSENVQPLCLMASLPASAQMMWNRKRVSGGLAFHQFFWLWPSDFASVIKTIHYVCQYEETLCSSRVCEAGWKVILAKILQLELAVLPIMPWLK